MKIVVEHRSVYGTERFYPGCDISRGLLKLMGKKTFTEMDLLVLVNLGFVVECNGQYNFNEVIA